jgi:hypothetical protein
MKTARKALAKPTMVGFWSLERYEQEALLSFFRMWVRLMDGNMRDDVCVAHFKETMRQYYCIPDHLRNFGWADIMSTDEMRHILALANRPISLALQNPAANEPVLATK